MPRLWLGNACTEHMVDRMDLLTQDDFDGILFAMKRLVWLMRDGDALVLPRPVPGAFLDHVAQHTGISPDRVHVIAPDADLLTQGLLHSQEILGRLRELVTPDWEFRPYIHDRGAEVFARELGLVTGSPFVAEGGAELLNSKVVFRALAAGGGFAVPDGIPCRTSEDLSRTLQRLLTAHQSVILKRDRAVGGHGNIVITTDPSPQGTGALHTIVLRDPTDHEQVLKEAELTATPCPAGRDRPRGLPPRLHVRVHRGGMPGARRVRPPERRPAPYRPGSAGPCRARATAKRRARPGLGDIRQ